MLIIKPTLLTNSTIESAVCDQIANCVAAKNVSNSPAWLGEIISPEGRVLNIIKFSRVYICNAPTIDIRGYVINNIQKHINGIPDECLQTASGCPTRGAHQYIVQSLNKKVSHMSDYYHGVQLRYVNYNNTSFETSTTIFIDHYNIFQDSFHYRNVICITDDMLMQKNDIIDIVIKVEPQKIKSIFECIEPNQIERFICIAYKIMMGSHFNYYNLEYLKPIMSTIHHPQTHKGLSILNDSYLCEICDDPCFKHRYLLTGGTNIIICEYCRVPSNTSKSKRLFRAANELIMYVSSDTYKNIAVKLVNSGLKLAKNSKLQEYLDILMVVGDKKIVEPIDTIIVTPSHVFMTTCTYMSKLFQDTIKQYTNHTIIRISS